MEKKFMSGWKTYDKIDAENAEKIKDDLWMKGFFIESHENWDGKTRVRNFHELRQRDLMLFNLGDVRGKKILDIGCGSAEYLTVIGKMGAKFVAGQDLGKDFITKGRVKLEKENIEGKLIVGDVTKIEFPSNYFDSVISADFFEHITLQQKKRVIKEVYRVLKPGGSFTIKTPNLSYLKMIINIKRLINILKFKSPFIFIAHTNNNPDNEHHGLTTYSELTDILERNFFHSPIITYVPLIRKILPNFLVKFFHKKKLFSETIIITTKKALFYGFYE